MITTTHCIDFQRCEIGNHYRFKEIKEGLFGGGGGKKPRWNLVCVSAEKEAGFISWAKLQILIFLKGVLNHFKQEYHKIVLYLNRLAALWRTHWKGKQNRCKKTNLLSQNSRQKLVEVQTRGFGIKKMEIRIKSIAIENRFGILSKSKKKPQNSLGLWFALSMNEGILH